jgi:hypothetical protein
MSKDVLGSGVIGLISVTVISLVLTKRRRRPEAVVTLGSARGRPGLAIHPWRGHWFATAVGWLLLALIVLFGLYELKVHNYYAAVFLLGGGLMMGYVGWCRATGRSGDGTITLTFDGIHQLYAGSEVFIPWDDVRGLVTTPTDLIVKTGRQVVPVQHMLPLVGGRRGVVMPDAIALPSRGMPPLPFPEMFPLYSTGPAARDELGTDEAVQRAREIVADLPRQPALLGLWPAVRGTPAEREQPVDPMQLILDVIYVLVLGWVLWVTFGAERMEIAAANGEGHPGIMVIEGQRPARGEDIPVGTFIEQDGTTTADVAWQDRPAAVGDRKEGVRVRDRAWEPGVRRSLWDAIFDATLVGFFAWRVLVLVRHCRRRGRSTAI